MKSPFEYTSPEALPVKDILDLFVPVFGEYLNVPTIGHTFVNGPRGSGKSMIFRYMSPDCQSIATSTPIRELDYFGIHIPIKEGHLDKTDLSLLNGKHGEALLNEHFMVINFGIKIFEKLGEIQFDNSRQNIEELRSFFSDVFLRLLNNSRWGKQYELEEEKSIEEIFLFMMEICKDMNRDFNLTLMTKLFSAEGNHISYSGPICQFIDFLLELLSEIRNLSFMPNAPIYLLIDDADNLSKIQTKILNTWVSYRSSKTISFKISTQLRYKTYKTLNNSRIDTPHDYSEINISDIYTSKKGLYKERIRDAVKRRLNKFGFKDTEVEEFFPPDLNQQEEIDKIFEMYEKDHGYDYAYRYAKPDFMKSMKGNLNHFSYAGFDSLVNISSGVMRHFIDFAHRMYTRQVTKSSGDQIHYITDSIQDEEIKEYAAWFYDENFTKLREDEGNTEEEIDDFDKLRNLIEALGQTFHLILFSDATERRVFSFALQDEPDEELRRVLRLGVETGYFHKSLIGNKMGTGKAQLYIMNRLLAPYFKLDPTSFAGYKFVRCELLKEALIRPNTIVGRIQRNGIDAELENPQQSLFQDQ